MLNKLFYFSILLLVCMQGQNVLGNSRPPLGEECSALTAAGNLPLDFPTQRKRPRLYVALTNKCNRACPWCSVFSSPKKNTFLTPEQMEAHFPKDRSFDLQLEGGEPTIHPQLFDFVSLARANPLVHEIILITNGVKLPREKEALKAYFERFGSPFKIKLSINHYLLERDKGLIDLARLVKTVISELGGDRHVIFNVRLRKGEQYNDDKWVNELVAAAHLVEDSNIFYIQRYGLASDEEEWEEPSIFTEDFVLINPDGSAQGTDLVQRSNEMGKLP